MKLKSLLLSTVLVASPWIASAQAGKKADLQDVTKNLDMDGEFFVANSIAGDISALTAIGNDFVKTAQENGHKRIPKDLNVKAILKDMGVDQILAYGRSAKHMDDHWVNKMYLQNNGSKKGIFSLMGKNNSTYDVINFAPSGSDLVAEWSVDTSQLLSSMKSVPKCEKTTKFLSRKLPSGETMEDMMNSFKAKMSLAVKLDDEKREVCPVYPEYTFPKMHGIMRMKGANQIWNQVGKMAGFVMKVEKQEDGTLLLTPRKQKKGMNVVLLMDTRNDLLWAATSPEFLAECRGDGAKLASDEDFKTISDGVKKGKALAYISNQACLEIKQVKEAKVKKMNKKRLSDDMIQKIMDYLTESKNGYFAEAHKSKKGINYVLKAPLPIKEMMCGKRGFKKKGCSSCKGSSSCDKGCSSCQKSEAKKGCACEAGKCKCAKEKTSCKCESECKCAKDKSKATPKGAKPPKSKAATEGPVAPKAKKKADKKAEAKKAKPAPKKEAKPAPKKEAKPAPAKDFTTGGDQGDM